MYDDWRNILAKVGVFFKTISWKKTLTFSLFVFIAAILWFMQIYNQTFETNIHIPITYTSIPDSIIFNDSLPQKLEVKVKDYGYAMFKYKFQKRDTIHIDVTPILKNGANKQIQGSALEAYISNTLPPSATLLRYDPVRLSFVYSPLESRKVPVLFDGQINLASGYFLNGDIQVTPDSVMAYSSQADLAKLTYIYTTSDTINGLNSSRDFSFNLVDIENIRINPHKINVYVPVEAYRQMKINVPVECFNLPDNLTVKFFPSSVTISFFIGVSIADSVETSDFVAGVDYEGLKESKQISVPVRVTESHPQARDLRIDPPNVEYIFEYK